MKPKFRYPYFIELHWYALARYVDCLLNVNYLVPVKLEAKKEEQMEEKEEVKSKEEAEKEMKKEPPESEMEDNADDLPMCAVKKEVDQEVDQKPFPSSKVRHFNEAVEHPLPHFVQGRKNEKSLFCC